MSNQDSSPSADRRYAGQRLRQEVLDGVDLAGADMARSELDQVSLRGADLRGACLCGAKLSRVDLTGAKLDGADLRGARLDRVVLDDASMNDVDARGVVVTQSNIEGVQASDARLAGAELTKVTLSNVTLDRCVLDGARLDDVAISSCTLRELSMVGLWAAGCALIGSSLTGCDLSGATFEDCELKELSMEDCELRAVGLQGSRVAKLSSDDSRWQGAVLEGCRGLSRETEEQLVGAGAALVHPPAVRALRLLRSSRKLQIAVVVALVLLVLAVVVLLRSPGLWPSSVLLSRFQALESRSDVARCEPLIRVADVLAERDGVERSQRYRVLERASTCELELERPERARAALDRYVALASERPGDELQALVALGGFLLLTDDLTAAEQTAQDLYEAADGPTERLAVLRYHARVLDARGERSGPAAPADEPVADDPWRSLQLDMSDALMGLTALAPHQLEETPIELFVLGEWDRAEQLLSAVNEPPIAASDRWQHQRRAAERLVDEGRVDLASAMLEAVSVDSGLADLVDVERLALRMSLLRRLEQVEQAQALLDGLPPTDDPRMLLELSLVRARFTMDLGEPAEARAMLEQSPPDPALPYDVLARYGWLLADARLASGDEAAAVDALEPLLVAVPDPEPAQNLLRELATWMEQLEEPARIMALLERVDNPLLDKAGQGQELALTSLRAQAREGPIPPDDPTLLDVLSRGTPEQVTEAAAILLQGARSSGTVADAITALLPHARKLADTRAREGLGLMLAEAAVGEGDYAVALDVLDDLRILDSDAVDIRSRGLALTINVALQRGQLDDAVAQLQAAAARPGELEDWLARDMGRRVVDALQQAGRYDEALAHARALHQAEPEMGEGWFEALSSLVALGDEAGFASEREAAQAALGPCRGLVVAARAQQDHGRTPTELSALEQACSSAASSVDDALVAASVLGQAGRPQAALALVDGLIDRDLEPRQRALVDRERANWLAATGDRDGAVGLLEGSYAELGEAPLRQQATAALIGHLAGRGEPDPIIEAYLRFVADHPDHQEPNLWKQAALALIQLGSADRVGELQGPPGWMRHISREAERARLRDLIEAGDHEAAWDWLDQALGTSPAADQRVELLYAASGLADRSGDPTRLLAWLDGLDAVCEPGTELYQRARLHRARALASLDDSAGALEVLAPLVTQDMEPGLRSEALERYGRGMGDAWEPEAIKAEIDVHLAKGGIQEAHAGILRLRAAEKLLARGEAEGAWTVIADAPQRSLEPNLAEPSWDVMARACLARGRSDDALTIPQRFPSAEGSCGAWLAVLTHLPGEAPELSQVRDGALAACDPTALPVHRARVLASALSRSDPARALTMLEQVRQGAERTDGERAELDLERARLLAEQGEHAAAGALLEAVLDAGVSPGLSSRATVQLMQIAVAHGDGGVEDVERLAEAGLVAVQGDPAATRDIVREAVGTLRQQQAWELAIAWQLRLVELHANPDEGRGYTLLQLVHLHLDASDQVPAAADDAWLEALAEAQTLAPPGGHLDTELATLAVAWELVSAGSEARILAVLRRAAAERSDPGGFANAVAARLDRWTQDETASVVRAERERMIAE